MDAATKHQQGTTDPSKPSAIVTGLNAGLKSPLLWAPILGIAVVLLSIHLPAVVAGCFELIGSAPCLVLCIHLPAVVAVCFELIVSATSGVAVFAVYKAKTYTGVYVSNFPEFNGST